MISFTLEESGAWEEGSSPLSAAPFLVSFAAAGAAAEVGTTAGTLSDPLLIEVPLCRGGGGGGGPIAPVVVVIDPPEPTRELRFVDDTEEVRDGGGCLESLEATLEKDSFRVFAGIGGTTPVPLGLDLLWLAPRLREGGGGGGRGSVVVVAAGVVESFDSSERDDGERDGK